MISDNVVRLRRNIMETAGIIALHQRTTTYVVAWLVIVLHAICYIYFQGNLLTQ